MKVPGIITLSLLLACGSDPFSGIPDAHEPEPDAREPLPDGSLPSETSTEDAGSADGAASFDADTPSEADASPEPCAWKASAKCGGSTCSSTSCCQGTASEQCVYPCYTAVQWGCEASEVCGAGASCCANGGNWSWLSTSTCPLKMNVSAPGGSTTCMGKTDCAPVFHFCQSNAACPSGKTCERTLVYYSTGSLSHEVGVCK